MKILVVDDNRSMTEVIKAMLQRGRHRVKTAGNGEEGYNTFLDFQPELVITDIQMPGKDGFALMEAIRCRNPRIRTIYMSGDLGRFRLRIESEKQRYCVDGLGKPFTLKELNRALKFVRNGTVSDRRVNVSPSSFKDRHCCVQAGP